MKRSIIFLGLVALSFTNANATTFKSQDLDQQESATVTVENTQEQSQALLNQETSNETTVNTEADTAVFSPNSVMKSVVKTTTEVIAEDKQIIDSKEEAYQPISIGYTVEDRIAEDNQIIESTTLSEAFPLDFNKINRSLKPVVINSAIKVKGLKL